MHDEYKNRDMYKIAGHQFLSSNENQEQTEKKSGADKKEKLKEKNNKNEEPITWKNFWNKNNLWMCKWNNVQFPKLRNLWKRILYNIS